MNDMTNLPGQPSLRRRVRVHGEALQALRDALGAPTRSAALRGLARQETTDPALALLDAWAVVSDVVAFYTERIATEGYLRTATERGSVRELARTLGYELRAGVAAQVELAFHVETAPGAPTLVQVPAGTPAQSIPGQGELPQTFETSDDLTARAAWNALRGVAVRRQTLGFGTTSVWLAAPTSTLRPGDQLLLVGAERRAYGGRPGAGTAHGVEGFEQDREKWDLRTVQAVVAEPEGFSGWTRVDLDRRVGYRTSRPLVAERAVRVHALTERTQLFGANAPDPDLLVTGRSVPPTIEAIPGTSRYRWKDYGAVDTSAPDEIELDGDRKGVLTDSWLVLDQPGLTEAYRVEDARADGASEYGTSGRITRVRVDVAANLAAFDRRQAIVLCTSVEQPARLAPVDAPVTPGDTLHLVACDPLLPPERLLLVQGTDALTGLARTELTEVVACTLDDVPDDEELASRDEERASRDEEAPWEPPPADVPYGTRTMTVTVKPALTGSYVAATLVVHANVAPATHGETVTQVLGSGDGQASFRRFSLRRAPLTAVRATTPSGARPELVVRVDGVQWHEVENLADAGPQDRVHVVRQLEGPTGGDNPTQVVQGDGLHGARAPTGSENITATYRVGIGEPGDVDPGQVSLLVRRPLGIKDVVNPASSHDWAPPETLEEARRNAPQRVRTLDRIVSLTDAGDLARGYAGVGHARADLVWDGRTSTVVLSALAVGGKAPSPGLVTDLTTTADDARDPGQALVVVPGRVRWFGVRVDVAHHPDHVRADVEAAVRATLEERLAVGVRDFAEPVTSAGVLVLVREVAGVRACTMPRLFALGDLPPVAPSGVVPLPPDAHGTDLLVAFGARWDGVILPAQLLALPAGAIELGVMA